MEKCKSFLNNYKPFIYYFGGANNQLTRNKWNAILLVQRSQIYQTY